jgi:hypothetical protein
LNEHPLAGQCGSEKPFALAKAEPGRDRQRAIWKLLLAVPHARIVRCHRQHSEESLTLMIGSRGEEERICRTGIRSIAKPDTPQSIDAEYLA